MEGDWEKCKVVIAQFFISTGIALTRVPSAGEEEFNTSCIYPAGQNNARPAVDGSHLSARILNTLI
jgi:hypothetical protein